MAVKRFVRLKDSAEGRRLILDHLDLDPVVARRLSPAVAAKDRRVTVAMADPTDAVALEAVASELGGDPYVVQIGSCVLLFEVVLLSLPSQSYRRSLLCTTVWPEWKEGWPSC